MKEPEKLPPGHQLYHAREDFITPWGPRYVQGQEIKLTDEQAEQLRDRGVLEEHPIPEKKTG